MTDTVFDSQHSDHDHQRCIARALELAHARCQQRRQRLTPIRELVLKLIWQSHRPMAAYDLLPALAAAGFNSAPPTVYRALEFLQELGLVHRLASLNAFIGCSQSECQQQGCFFICRHCHITQELDSHPISQAIHQHAQELGFTADHTMVEVMGICPDCAHLESRP